MNVLYSSFIFSCIILGSNVSTLETIFSKKCVCPSMNCKNDQVKCIQSINSHSHDGRYCMECLDKEFICNGLRNCHNSEDENVERCGKNKCRKNEFQCEYGACVPMKLYCNGVIDCFDGSDEPDSCKFRGCMNQTTTGLRKCHFEQYHCISGECIHKAFKCDGKPQCKDMSDELSEICENENCSGDDFRCTYGACVKKKHSKCDNIKDCMDGSDEVGCPKLFGSLTFSSCILPTIDGVIFVNDSSNLELLPGTFIDIYETVSVKCEPGYHKDFQQSFKICKEKNQLKPETDIKCLKMCPSLISDASDTLDIKCTLNGNYANCSNLSIPGTIAIASCKPTYIPSQAINPSPLQLRCQNNGTWDNKLYTCCPYCGKVKVYEEAINPNISNGTIASFEMAPWNVAVYKININNFNYEFKCGGTLIASNLVVSVAHCFWGDNGTTPNPNEELMKQRTQYKLVVGKFDYNFSVTDYNFTQKMNIEKIYIRDYFFANALTFSEDIAVIVLENQVVMSEDIRPICIHWKTMTELSNGDMGRVYGWSLKKVKVPNPVLLYALFPFISYEKCGQFISKDFARFRTLDKLCAGYGPPGNPSTDGLQYGDSGGSLAFLQNSIYYFVGIASLKDSTQNDSVSLFTDVRHFTIWLKQLFKIHAPKKEHIAYGL